MSAPARNQRGESWEETRSRLEAAFPTLAAAGRVAAMSDDRVIEVLGEIMKDALRTDMSSSKRGWRPQLDPDTHAPMISSAFRNLVDPEYATLPFSEALQILREGNASEHLSEKSDIDITRITALANAEAEPSWVELEQIAAALGKDRFYFLESRALAIAASVMQHLIRDPDQSAALVRQIRSL